MIIGPYTIKNAERAQYHFAEYPFRQPLCFPAPERSCIPAFHGFTQANLNRLIPDENTHILIYCNNNFIGDQVNFTTKTAAPSAANNHTPLTLALNIPTYINLFGYGYKNVYELDELVNVTDGRIQFEGAAK